MKFPLLNMVLDAEPEEKFEPVEHLAPVTRVEQHGDKWCWAACLVSVLGIGSDPVHAQADLVNDVLGCGLSECGDSPPHQQYCDKSRQPKLIERIWKKVWPGLQSHPGPYADLPREIAAGRPVHVVYERHTVMIEGWKRDRNGTEDVQVMDPQDGSRTWKGVAVIKNYGSAGDCLLTIYNIT